MNSPQMCRAAAMLLAVAAAPSGAANLLANGSFEVATGIASNSTLSAGATNLTGWTVVGGGNLLWCDSSSYCGVPASDGTFSLDLTGLTNVAPYAGVQQSIATVAGHAYELTFDLAGRYDSTPVSVQASAGSTSSNFTNSSLAWVSQKLSFTAAASTTLIEIVGVSAGLDGLALQVDNAVVAGAVPEPASWALLLSGGAVLVAARHRLRAARSDV